MTKYQLVGFAEIEERLERHARAESYRRGEELRQAHRHGWQEGYNAGFAEGQAMRRLKMLALVTGGAIAGFIVAAFLHAILIPS